MVYEIDRYRSIKIAFNCSVNRNIANIRYRLVNYNS